MCMGGPACYEGPTLREAHEKGRELTQQQVPGGPEVWGLRRPSRARRVVQFAKMTHQTVKR